MKRITAILSAALISTGMVAAPAAFAQEAAQGEAPVQGEAQAPVGLQSEDISDEQLENFINASQDLTPLAQDYSEQLVEAGEDANRAEEIREEANDEMVQVVVNHDLEIEEFNQIGQAMQTEQALQERVQGMIE